MEMAITAALAAVLAFGSGWTEGQGVPPAPPETAPVLTANPAANQRIVAMRTPVLIRIESELNSKTSRIGDTFPIRLGEPVHDASGEILLPAGTPGRGEVIHAAKAGFGGKPGELILAVRYLECGDTRVPLGHFRFAETGKDNGGAAGAVNAAAAGAATAASVGAAGVLIAFMITGGQIHVPMGTLANAKITADVAMTKEATAACSADAAPMKGEARQ